MTVSVKASATAAAKQLLEQCKVNRSEVYQVSPMRENVVIRGVDGKLKE